MSHAPRVSVVIPSKNGGAGLLSLVGAVLAQDLPEPFEVIVVDSGSTDGSPQALAPPVRLLTVPARSFDHGATRNYAIGMARGEIVALTVQDAVPADRRWLAELVAALRADPGAAGAYSRQLPRPHHPAFVRRAVEAWAAGGAAPRVQAVTAASLRAMTPLDRLDALAFDNVASALRRDVWRAYRFAAVPFGEDLDWSRRVLLAGHRILYVPASRVLHSHDRGGLHELRRTYVGHRELHRMLGISMVRDGRHLAGAVAATVRGNLAAVRADAPRAPRSHLLRAVSCAAGSVLGQYLGPRSAPLLDRLLARGI